MKDDDGRARLDRLLGQAWAQPRVRALWQEMKRLHGGDRDAAGREFIARVVAEPDLREGLVTLLVASMEAEIKEQRRELVRH